MLGKLYDFLAVKESKVYFLRGANFPIFGERQISSDTGVALRAC